MFKFVVLAALVAVASAAPGGLFAAPAFAAPYAVAHQVPVATSYANTYKVSVKSPIVAAPALAYTHPAAVVAAAPTYLKAAPLAYAHAPVAAYAAPTYVHSAPLAYTGYGPAYIH